jgi:hypothetical protein
VFKAMGGGFVGVKNRNTQSIVQVDLAASAEDEMNWLLTHSAFSISGPKAFLQPVADIQNTNGDTDDVLDTASSTVSSYWECVTPMELSPLGKIHLGLSALMTRIDWMFNQHLNASWVPGELAKNAEERARLQQSLASLGKDPATINLNNSGDLCAIVKSKIATVFTPEKIDALCDSPLFDLANFSWEPLGATSRYTRMAAIDKLHTQMKEHLSGGSSALVIAFAASLAQEVKA